MKKSLSAFLRGMIGIILLVGCLTQAQARDPKESTLTLNRNIFELGNVWIDDCYVLRVDQLEPNHLDTLCHFGNFAVDPNFIMLTNEVCPVIKFFDPETGCWIALPDTNGLTAFSGDVGIFPDKKMLVNEINPVKFIAGEEGDDGEPKLVEDDEQCAFTHLSGDMCVRNYRITGQTDKFSFLPNEKSVVLRIFLKNDTSDLEDPNLATGVFVGLKFFGVGDCGDGGEYASYFDVFYEVDIFAGQGAGSDSGTCGKPIVKFGHTDTKMLVTIGVESPEPNIIDICFTPLDPTMTFIETLQEVIGCFYYDICGKNIERIECFPSVIEYEEGEEEITPP